MQMSRSSKLFIKRNNTTILTIVGAAGVVATAISTAKATTKASRVLQEAEKEKGEVLTKSEKFKIAAPIFIPSVLFGTATIACMFGANILSKNKQASIMSAYALMDQSFKDYKAKTIEIYGPDADEEIRNAVAKDKFMETLIIKKSETMLFYDEFSDRFFESTIEHVKDAEYHFNRNFTIRGYADLNEWYEFVGLEEVDYGYELGWSQDVGEASYGYRWVDFTHHVIDTESGDKCCVIRMPFEPHDDYLE